MNGFCIRIYNEWMEGYKGQNLVYNSGKNVDKGETR